MKINKTNINGYDVFIHKTKKYSSIIMRFLFELEYTKENIEKCDLLEEYMIHSTRKYKSRKELGDKKRELYSMNFSMGNYNRGEKLFVEATLSFYDPDLVKDNYFKEALELFKEVLMHPNFRDGKLDKFELNRARDDLISYMGESLMDSNKKVYRGLIENLYPNTYLQIDKVKDKKEYEKSLNSYVDKDIIKMHDKLINHSLVGLIIMGNVKDEYLKVIKHLFKFKETRKIDRKFKEHVLIDETTDFKCRMVDNDTKESILHYVYACNSNNFKDKIACYMISSMLGSTGHILYKVLRDERQLVYHVGASYNARLDILILKAYIDKNNEEKAIEGLTEAVKKLENKELIQKLLDKINEEDDIYMYTFDESKWNVFSHLYAKAFKLDKTDEEKIKVAKTIAVDDILDALKRIELKKIYFYEGAKE